MMYRGKKYSEMELVVKYEEQKQIILSQLKPGEKIKHCIDHAYNDKFYNPYWVVTSHARVWTLWEQKWLLIKLKDVGVKSKNNKYHQKKYYVGGRIDAAVLTAFYFCDRLPFRLFGYKNCVVHHKRKFHDYLTNEQNNSLSNLCYQLKTDHQQIINNFQDSRIPSNQKPDFCTQYIISQLNANENAEIYFMYGEDGSKQLITTLKLQGTTAAEEEELRKVVGNSF